MMMMMIFRRREEKLVVAPEDVMEKEREKWDDKFYYEYGYFDGMCLSRRRRRRRAQLHTDRLSAHLVPSAFWEVSVSRKSHTPEEQKEVGKNPKHLTHTQKTLFFPKKQNRKSVWNPHDIENPIDVILEFQQKPFSIFFGNFFFWERQPYNPKNWKKSRTALISDRRHVFWNSVFLGLTSSAEQGKERKIQENLKKTKEMRLIS
ncbi:Protein CBG24889 [Caenorhabditis briggsae]|uniref:Protein CBG24889 n=1 Tax=Caenorhabditis briggsae TaxID=6238 RepID=A8WLP7_CAEBR|nr:Protein CBG24889 [Caenorhabditis briggsae]CAP21393.1 Protein CBG24889 [Caenorhabditis briggsae]